MSTTAFATDRPRKPSSWRRMPHASAPTSAVSASSVEDGPNLEARARTARYAALPVGVLTGHTADDQAETVLINLLRGAGTSGLAAMRLGPQHPILALRRSETVALCEALQLPTVHDPSNTDPRHLRNRVRHELLPLMAALAQRDPVPILSRQAALTRDEDDLLEHLAAALDPTDARALAAAPIALGETRRAPLADRHPPTRRRHRRARPGRGPRHSPGHGRRRRAQSRTSSATADPRPRRTSCPASNLTAHSSLGTTRGGRLMPPRLRGKWALGITPRNFTWFMKDKLAVCERPGGYGDNHRRVRRQEEIIWLRENGFGCVVSIIPAPHNLHNYDELGMPYLHRPFTGVDDLGLWLKSFYTEINHLMEASTKVIAHNESVDDRIIGIMGGYIRWSGMVDDPSTVINLTERIAKRQLDPFAREVILMAHELR